MLRLTAGPLLLEPLLASHAEAMFDLLRAPALYRYLDHPPPPSLEHLRTVYERQQRRTSPDGKQHWLNWVMRLEGGAPVGYVQATVSADGSAWIAYVTGVAFQGKGYASLAVSAMLEHLAQHYSVWRFLAQVEAANGASIRLLEKLGFALSTAGDLQGHDLGPSERLYVLGITTSARAS